MKRFFAIFTLVSFVVFSPARAKAQTMDIVQIVQQLLSQYQNELEGMDVEKSLGNIGEMSELSGLPGVEGMVDKFKSLGGDFMKDASKKFRPMVPAEISEKLDKPKEVKAFAKDKLIPKVDAAKGGTSAAREELNTMKRTVQQSSVLEAFGNSVSSQELAKEASKQEDDTTEVATGSDSARDNTKMLTAMTVQSVKTLAQIRSLEASLQQKKTSQKVDSLEEKKGDSTGRAYEEGSW